MPRCRIDETGTYLVKESGTYRVDPAVVDRTVQRARRRAVEAASVRPMPGTSDTLGQPLRVTTVGTVDNHGKVKAVDAHDLTGMMPVQLIGHPLKLHGRRKS